MGQEEQTVGAAQEVLRRFFGHTAFREGQRELVEGLLGGGDVLGIMPTGAGKSVCYQVPALMLAGITLVISPLISLMKDQVNALTQQGVRAAYLNSSLTPGQYAKAMENARAGAYKIIYVAPERLMGEGFLRFAAEADISLVTVDEAHCVSQWGQDFRPSYLQIPAFLEQLPRRPVLGAFTATATDRVRDDIVELLGLREPRVLVTGFDRPNLHFAVRRPAKKDDELLAFLDGGADHCGIVYCATRKNVEAVCDLLNRHGYSATRYHAGLGDEERRCNQDDFVYDRRRIIVATNAFGMGIDKSDVRFVVHYNMPGDLESYYQEAGRAGRDGERAVCLLLYAPKDVQTQKFFIENSYRESKEEDPAQREKLRDMDLDRLRLMTFYATTTDCLRGSILKYFGEGAPLYCGNCSNCNTQFEDKDITEDAQKIISCVYRIERAGMHFGKGMVANVLRGSQNERIRRFGLDKLPTYGLMKDTPMRVLGGMMDFLIQEDWLRVNDQEYDVVETNERSRDVVRGGARLTMKLPKTAEKQAKREKTVSDGVDMEGVDTALYNTLRTLRGELAKAAGVPAYVVFSNASLRDMCRLRPVSAAAFRQVSGVGDEKARRYADAFTGAIKTYLEETGGEPPGSP